MILISVLALQQWQGLVVRRHARDKATAELAYRAALRTWNVELADPSKNALAASGMPARQSRQDPATRQQLSARLFVGRSPGLPPPYVHVPSDGVAWDDPVRNLVFVIRFKKDDTWQSFAARPRSQVLWDAEPAARHPVLERIEPVRRAWVDRPISTSIGTVLWLALTLAALIPTRHSGRLAHAQLAVACLCLLGWLMADERTLATIVSNVPARWGVGLVIVGIVILWYLTTRPQRRWRDPRYCVKCGYDLTGNVSGVCPECGLAVLSGRRGRPARLRVSLAG